MTTDLTIDIADFIATVEVHRPPANFFDVELISDLADTFEKLDKDPECRAIVLCSEGKHFCAGNDFSRSSNGAPRSSGGGELYKEAVRLFSAETPVVAAVQGAAVGGGLGLALSADFRVASPSSRFAANFTQLGFHQGFGLTVTLPRLVGQQAALDMILTGRRVKGDEAFAMGLCDELVPEEGLRAAARARALQLAASAPLAVVSARKSLRGDLADQVRIATDIELREQTRLRTTEDFREGIAASAARREPKFKGR
ncbi:enoyl-CoA hydratase/carnithine racemase [Antricoccus suffuscus]|uniref:Enoyl-CoA hydratase/carnithine racemase n=1 Tax=Antricoccus suffuscus TaxID=1629062 RepID=A0A2T1A719_9ACTN|nr:enoyl-CoA hydratase/isomerase family protein [Antricoccus suffuscus]PRZ44403.1 enoyl-CoA hydratase/carnithine racemase [Antricoccus suffuscus]